jgi:hypothetical protein
MQDPAPELPRNTHGTKFAQDAHHSAPMGPSSRKGWLPKFSGSPTVASRNRLPRFLAPFVATSHGSGSMDPSAPTLFAVSSRRDSEIATANFREFFFHALR